MESFLPCSVPILTLNRKPFLERLLPVLKAQFDDVFLVDGNSTDGTREFAQSLGVRVERQTSSLIPNQRIIDFTAARLRSWSLARHGWVFVVDADELPSDALFACVAAIVRANHRFVAHRFGRVACLPDGREVQHAFFYPETTMVRLFHRESGITLTRDRRVHERFLVPPEVSVALHAESFLHTLEVPCVFAAKHEWYVALERREDAVRTAASIWRWEIWYNVRSGVGQVVRSVVVWIHGSLRRQTVLPWAYTTALLRYRFRLVWEGVKGLSKRSK